MRVCVSERERESVCVCAGACACVRTYLLRASEDEISRFALYQIKKEWTSRVVTSSALCSS